jgi:hypothetical protein
MNGMRLLTRFYFLAFLILSAASVSAQRMQVKGYVVDKITGEGLAGVHVIKTSGMGTITDEKGNFNLFLRSADTLTFSSVGYERLHIPLQVKSNVHSLLISLKPEVIILDSMTIRPQRSDEPLVKRPQPKPYRVPGVRYAPPYDPAQKYHLGVVGSISSPITALYRLFSKQYKEEKLYFELRREWERKLLIKKLSHERMDHFFENVRLIVPREYYPEILEKCNLNAMDVLELTDYDLYMRLKTCQPDLLISVPDHIIASE